MSTEREKEREKKVRDVPRREIERERHKKKAKLGRNQKGSTYRRIKV